MEIGTLVNLQGLYLDNNKIIFIPKEISLLVNLQELILFNNKITTILEEIILLKNNGCNIKI